MTQTLSRHALNHTHDPGAPTDRSRAAYEPTPQALRDSNLHCAEVVRTRARNFYHGLRLTPEPRRSAIYSVYAWMRRADDAVDAPGTPHERRERLDHLRAATHALLERAPLPADEQDHPVWPAFADTIHRHGIERFEVQSMLDGLEADALADHDSRLAVMHASRDELEQYCFRVASVVGRVCVRIWGLRPGVDLDAALALAEQRGLAFQLTNILRDFREDFDDFRLYVPTGDLDAHDLSPEQLRAFDPPDRAAALVRSIARWARDTYDQSAPLDAMIAPDCAPAMWAMTRIYSGLLDRIEADPARVVSGTRIRLASWRKLSIGLTAAARARLAAAS